MNCILFCTLLIAGGQDGPAAPLTQIQISKLQQVVRNAQHQKDAITADLENRQRELMDAYSEFKLNEKQIVKLHQETVELQRQLLDNYRHLQVELRDIVGKPGFLRLKRRVASRRVASI
jgi:peptidoglycan hydrolase CwlO-like protein